MEIVVCPQCGNQQDGGIQCRRCFAFLADAPTAAADRSKPAPGLFRRVYWVLRWTTLAGLILIVVLVLRKSSPPQVPADPQAAARVESKLRESQSAAEARQPHQLRLDAPEVNTFLGAHLALKQESAPAGSDRASGAPASSPPAAEPTLEEVQSSVKDVKINMLADRVQAYVLFDFHGKELSLVLEGRLHVQDGYLRFEPTGGKLGSLPLPQSTLESAVERLLASPENKEKLRVPAEISDIQIQNGELVVSYR